MAQPHVPKFGNWDTDGATPYTKYFDNARKNKAGVMINPNDPTQNPEAFAADVPTAQAQNDAMTQKTPARPPQQRTSGGDQSPLHPIYQANSVGRGGGHAPSMGRRNPSEGQASRGRGHAPSMGRRNSSEGPEQSPSTPARIKRRGDGYGTQPEKGGVTVPRFGGWNEGDPKSGENYTGIFNQLRDNRSSPAPTNTTESSHPMARKRDSSPGTNSCSCFGWFMK